MEGPGQDKNHSARKLKVPKTNETKEERLQSIKWSNATKKEEWSNLDNDLDTIQESSLSGPIEKKIQAMTTITYSSDRFGEEEKCHLKPHIVHIGRRQKDIKDLGKELKDLKKRDKQAGPIERNALRELRVIVRSKLKTLR
ncbi:unnamed protein product [Owenia fusiformis]|uniref:Uncharacterized protein n=1 Tax=Owenia fusiformis TaxID=6347 RepID=A0A8J1U5H4_OWEFU|nr:unnamed protein product [Owenia fusiformis]